MNNTKITCPECRKAGYYVLEEKHKRCRYCGAPLDPLDEVEEGYYPAPKPMKFADRNGVASRRTFTPPAQTAADSTHLPAPSDPKDSRAPSWDPLRDNVAVGSRTVPQMGTAPRYNRQATDSADVRYRAHMEENGFLNELRIQGTTMKFFLVSKNFLEGCVIGFDADTIVVRTKMKNKALIYKHAVTTIEPAAYADD